MIGTERIRALSAEVAAHPAPVISLYLDVNPARPDNARKAYALRARAAMDRLGVPKRAGRRLTERLRQDQGIPDARTLVVFAGMDESGFFESYTLRSELPLVAAEGGVVARWGEPYLAPLLLTVQESQRYLVLLLATDRVRLFELYLEEAVELDAYVQPLDASDWRPLREHSTGMPGVPARGGSGKDIFDKRVADWRRRFHHDVARRIDGVLASLGGDVRLILMGQPHEIAAFEPHLPPALQARVVERLAATANPAAPASELEPLLTSAVARVEAAAGGALLDRIREQGVWGFGPTLEAVQEGRIHVLAVPWRMSARVFRCSESGRVTVTPDAAERLCPGEAPREVPLADVLPDLVSRHAIKLAVMHGDNETRLTTAFDGLAGLTRW
ncbi:MAG TPA: VLRF1 family aeRF1-type release factor [Trueperaceae bacterium]|nr:VLRF1 family aeRF1-type release factor [Trueperaceae bacterium]